MAGIPPAARGIRRTNHVCSVRACFNLLAPHVPWKMCDTCRAHDRQVRNIKKQREAGRLPLLTSRESKIAKVKTRKKGQGHGDEETVMQDKAPSFVSSTTDNAAVINSVSHHADEDEGLSDAVDTEPSSSVGVPLSTLTSSDWQ